MYIENSKHQNIGLIKFSNPPNNHANVDLLDEIGKALIEFDDDVEIRAVILCSEGKVFCGGADLATPNGIGGDNSSDAPDSVRQFYDKAIKIFSSKKPIIAAIQGAAVGAGLGLAVAADFRIANHNAKFSANFVKLGFHPGFALSYTLPRLIGTQNANKMFLTGDRIKAKAALEMGLIDEFVDNEDLMEKAFELANSIAINAPLALISTRNTLRHGLVENVINTLAHEFTEQSILKQTQDYKEGVASVFERRAANFLGK